MMTVDSILTFGKYKGEKLADVMDDDPGYIVWLSENTDLVFEAGIVEACQEAVTSGPGLKVGSRARISIIYERCRVCGKLKS